MTPNHKRVTIKQVADEAGVSTQTVSRVINDRSDVAPETRQRVSRIIQQLNYQPSNAARSLRGRSRTLGVMGYGVEYFGPSRNLAGIERQANELGYTLLLNLVRHPQKSDTQQALRDLLAHHIAGMIWAVPEIGDNHEWIQQEIAQLDVPVVFINIRPTPNLDIVAIDNHSGARLATHHLLDQSRRTIGLITGPLDWWEASQRKLGWREALKSTGEPSPDTLIFEGDWSAASGERGLVQLLERHPALDGLFACNDQMALGALKALREMKRRVPEDVAVVGFDDIPEAAFFCPPLSTVQQDMVELGRCAVKNLCRIIGADRREKTIADPAVTILEPQLVMRQSSGAPHPKNDHSPHKQSR